MSSIKSVLRGSMYQFLVAASVEVMCRPFKVQAIRQIHSLMQSRDVAFYVSQSPTNPFAGLVPQLLHDALIILCRNLISHLVMGKLHHILSVGTRVGNFGFWLTFKVISKCTTTFFYPLRLTSTVMCVQELRPEHESFPDWTWLDVLDELSKEGLNGRGHYLLPTSTLFHRRCPTEIDCGSPV